MIKVKIEASVAVVLFIPSKKKVMFKVIIKTPMAISLGRSSFLIFTFFFCAKKNGARRREAKANLKKAKLMGGNSSRVTFATTKLAPQIRWARIKTRYGRGLDSICENTCSITIPKFLRGDPDQMKIQQPECLF